jgi:hypothetical protein
MKVSGKGEKNALSHELTEGKPKLFNQEHRMVSQESHREHGVMEGY